MKKRNEGNVKPEAERRDFAEAYLWANEDIKRAEPEQKPDRPEAPKERRGRETGQTENGEFSADMLKRWLIGAVAAIAVSLFVGLFGGYLSSLQDKKEAVVLEADSAIQTELYLNRKGKVLQASSEQLFGAERFEGLLLEDGISYLLEQYAKQELLGPDGGILLTFRPAPEDIQVDLEQMLDEAEVYVKRYLKKTQARGKVYLAVLEADDEEIRAIAAEHDIPYGRAALVKNLIDKNTKLKLKDTDHLAEMEVKDIVQAMEFFNYKTSFRLVTAETLYEEETKQETSGKEEWRSELEETEDVSETESLSEVESTKEEEHAPERPKISSSAEPAVTAPPETTEEQESAGGADPGAEETVPAAAPESDAGETAPAADGPGAEETTPAADGPGAEGTVPAVDGPGAEGTVPAVDGPGAEETVPAAAPESDAGETVPAETDAPAPQEEAEPIRQEQPGPVIAPEPQPQGPALDGVIPLNPDGGVPAGPGA